MRASRWRQSADDKSQRNKVTLDGLLNALDGVQRGALANIEHVRIDGGTAESLSLKMLPVWTRYSPEGLRMGALAKLEGAGATGEECSVITEMRC